MRRRRLGTSWRWVLTLLTVLILAAWIDGGWRVYGIAPTSNLVIELTAGLVQVRRTDATWSGVEGRHDAPKFMWSFGAKSWGDGWYVAVPVWALFIPVAVGSAMLWARHVQLSRAGTCPSCGYDRRGLAGGADAKCPECGTTPTRG